MGVFGEKSQGGGAGGQNPKNKNPAQRHGRRLKMCMWVAEGMGMTTCGCVWRKKSRGRSRGQNPQNKNPAQRHGRMLKICVWVAEDLGMTVRYRAKGRRAPDLASGQIWHPQQSRG